MHDNQDEIQYVSSRSEKDNGLNKCPKCGASEITYTSSGQWLCSFCKHEWTPSSVTIDKHLNLEQDISKLKGVTITDGVKELESDEARVTIQCNGCGADVVINTDESANARCHWCRQTLSLNNKVPNGAVTDAIVPFKIKKAEAVELIRDFVSERKFFASKHFIEEFSPENVVGVYLPYLLVDGNLRAELYGEGEVLKRTYRSDDKTYYDAEAFAIATKFLYTVDDLAVEASVNRADIQLGDSQKNTNNIINAILPYNTKNAIPYDSTFMAGFNSERRTLSAKDLFGKAKDQFMSIARHVASTEVSPKFDRGIAWEKEGIEAMGSRWVSVYLPVWLYSYMDPRTNLLHYAAVNGETGKVMGSVPVNKPKLVAAAVAVGVPVEIVAFIVVIGALLA